MQRRGDGRRRPGPTARCHRLGHARRGRRGAHDIDGSRRPIPGDGSRAWPLRRQSRARGVCDRYEGSGCGSAVPGAPRHRHDAGLARAGAGCGPCRATSGSGRSDTCQANRRGACGARGSRRSRHPGGRRAGRRLAASGLRSVPASGCFGHRRPTGPGAGTHRHDRRHASAGRAAQSAAGLHARDDVRHGDGVRPDRPDQRDALVRAWRNGDVRRPGGHAWHAGSSRVRE